MNFNWHIIPGVSVGIKFVTFCQERETVKRWKEINGVRQKYFCLNATQS